jgi:hypothetical protein
MTLSPFLWPRFFADDSFYKNRCASRVLLKTKEPTTENSSAFGSYCPFPRPITRKCIGLFFDLQDDIPIAFSSHLCVVATLQDGFDSLYHFITVH